MKIASTTLILIVACNTACNSLHILPVGPSKHRLPSSHRSAFTILQAVPDEVLEEDSFILNDAKEEETTLTLRGEISVASADLPKTSIDDVVEFFKTEANRNLLVTGGGERPCNEIKVTPLQLNDWKSRCSALGACQPDDNDSILSIVSSGIQFPGLKVESNALIGVKFVESQEELQKFDESEEKRRNPRYEFVLLSNEQIVSGLAPAVWIFKKLTGADKNGEDENSKFDSLSTVTYEEKENGTIMFRTDALLSIGVTFPKFLLKILPGDKKSIEEKGGKSVIKTLDKDVSQSMKAFEKAYLEKFDLDL
jgi:hypothetical protein